MKMFCPQKVLRIPYFGQKASSLASMNTATISSHFERIECLFHFLNVYKRFSKGGPRPQGTPYANFKGDANKFDNTLRFNCFKMSQ